MVHLRRESAEGIATSEDGQRKNDLKAASQSAEWRRKAFLRVFSPLRMCAHFVVYKIICCDAGVSAASLGGSPGDSDRRFLHSICARRAQLASGYFPRAALEKIGSQKLGTVARRGRGRKSTWRFRVKSGYTLTPEAKAWLVGKGQGFVNKQLFSMINWLFLTNNFSCLSSIESGDATPPANFLVFFL